MWSFDNLNAVHLELSSRCNAACPGCPRFLRNSPNVDPDLTQRDISLSDFKSWFSPEILKKIRSWHICGTHGDPITCKDLIEIVSYICEYSDGSIQIHTNGGARNENFFSKLGKVLYDNTIPGRVRGVVFSVDGLEDTNHLYRRQVKWDKLIKNMKAYVATGGMAGWHFLRFAHNYHQIEEAKQLAESLGVHFKVKNPFGVDGVGMPVYDKSYNLDYVINHYERPEEKPYTPPEIGYIAPMPKKTNKQGCIECASFRQYGTLNINEIYIDHLGRVHPCCYVANKMFGPSISEEATEVRYIQSKLRNKNSLYYHNLKEIIDSDVLKVYSDSWENKSINQCWVQCGGDRLIDKLFVREIE